MRLDGLSGGEYIVKLRLEARSDTLATAYANHRRFLLRKLPLKKGERFSGSFAVAIKDADFQKQPAYRDTSAEISVFGDCEYTAEIRKTQLPVIFCLGDSTVCDQVYYGGSELERCCGWGQTLGLFLRDSFAVSNHAEQGTNTADCLSLHIKPVLRQLKQGDKVLVQFGHNDQKQPFLKPYGGYRDNLLKIAVEVTRRGGECILCTPINRLIFINGALNTYLDDYAAAVKSVAAETGLKCIDLHSFTSEVYIKSGDSAKRLFYLGKDGLDRTHPNDNGGTLIGEYVSRTLLSAPDFS